MKASFDRDTLIFDMKADHVPYIYHHEAFSNPHRSQFFFSWENLKVIHLERKNLIAQLVSKKIAEARNNFGEYDLSAGATAIWNNVRRQHLDDSDTPTPAMIEKWPTPLREHFTINLELEDFHRNLLELAESNKFLSDAVSCFRPLHLTYEEFFDEDGKFSIQIIEKLGAYLGVDPSAFEVKPLTKKQAQPDFLAPISNRDELIEKYANTDFSWMLSDRQ